MARQDAQPSISSLSLGEGGFEPYVRALRRHPLLIAAVVLTTLLGAGLWLVIRPERYRATAEVLVTPTLYYDPTYLALVGVIRDTPGDPFRAVETAATMLDSRSAAAVTAERFGRGWDTARVRAAVTVAPMGRTNVLAVQAQAAQPEVAARLANEYASAALNTHRRMLQSEAFALLETTSRSDRARIATLQRVNGGLDPTMTLLRPAAGPSASTAPGVRPTLTIALFVGVIVGIAVALVSDGVLRRQPRPDAAESSVSTLPSVGPQRLERRVRQDDSSRA